jgi:hypothetical protein
MTHAPATKRRPAEAPLHDRDLHAWSLEQARLLKNRRLKEIDAENLAEEILDVGSAEYDKLESALRVILLHMLKWDHQPMKRSLSWENTIAIQRRHVARQLQRNPSLKSRTAEAVTEAYFDARRLASSETDLDVASFPENCPYEWDDILTRKFER